MQDGVPFHWENAISAAILEDIISGMKNIQLWTLLTCLTTLLDKQHRLVIEYLKEENRILREHIYKNQDTKRILLTNSQRRRLAVKAKALGHTLLSETTDLFSPATIIGWYNKLIAKKYDGSANRGGGRTNIHKPFQDINLQSLQMPLKV